MKRFITLFVSFSFVVLSSFANKFSSRLIITSWSNATLTVTLDGNQLERFGNSFATNNVSSGYHEIKVYEVRMDRRVLKDLNSYRLIYSSNLFVKPGYEVSINLNRSGRVKIEEQEINRYDRNPRYDRNSKYPNHYPDNRGGYDPRNNNQPMTERMFLQAKETVRREAFDDAKLQLAKQIINSNALYSSQVKELTQLFSFDDYKLEFAKYAYSNTIDRNNYFILFDSFSFRKNKDALANYISVR